MNNSETPRNSPRTSSKPSSDHGWTPKQIREFEERSRRFSDAFLAALKKGVAQAIEKQQQREMEQD